MICQILLWEKNGVDKMIIQVLRIGQRPVRDDRVTTHVALVSRSFGAGKIYMTEVNSEIKGTLDKITKIWGGNFEVEFVGEWKPVVKRKKEENYKIVHLTMYGEKINDMQKELQSKDKLLVIVGAEKVPREVYELADYNVGVGSQPHSEISALAVFLDRIQDGRQFENVFPNAERKIIPTRNGKNVEVTETRD